MPTRVPESIPRPNCVIRVPAKDSYSTAGPSLMGRQSANEGFLTSWFRYTSHDQYWCLARLRDEAQVFAQIGTRVHQGLTPSPVYRVIAQQQIHRVAEQGTLYAPGPQVADLAWIRRRNGQARASDFSIVGMTHTSCELPIQDALAAMLTAPVYPWDAQICPSQAVQTMVQRLLDDEADWLRQHLAAGRVQPPQLPVLPLGVECEAFDLPAAEKAAHRAQWRRRWQLADDDIAVLYVGRLDLRTKANLLPTLDALSLASQQLSEAAGPRPVLVLAGWFASDWDQQTLQAAIDDLAPPLRVIIEDGRSTDVRRGVWHAADIFISLVDNIQETFGLTPIEAMAAGLPLVVSDYNGYRESVREGIDGFRIPTWQPEPGAGCDLVDLHSDVLINYRDYVSRASAAIGLDVARAAQALVSLAQDPTLRHQMGEAGRRRARETYDWQRLIPRYQALFQDLAQLRAGEPSADRDWPGSPGDRAGDWGSRYPRRSDPYHSFAHYPTASLGGRHTLRAGLLLPATRDDRERKLQQQLERPLYAAFQGELDRAELLQLLDTVVAQAPQGLAWTSSSQDPATGLRQQRQLGWLLKTGLVAIERPDCPSLLASEEDGCAGSGGDGPVPPRGGS